MSKTEPHLAAPAILIAHANAPERDWLSQLLTSRGYRVTSCDNGVDALRGIEAEKFALVLTAVSMPQSDGLELIRSMMERHSGTPVIAMASADPIEQIYLRSAEALGAATTYTMPISADALLCGVRNALHGAVRRVE